MCLWSNKNGWFTFLRARNFTCKCGEIDPSILWFWRFFFYFCKMSDVYLPLVFSQISFQISHWNSLPREIKRRCLLWSDSWSTGHHRSAIETKQTSTNGQESISRWNWTKTMRSREKTSCKGKLQIFIHFECEWTPFLTIHFLLRYGTGTGSKEECWMDGQEKPYRRGFTQEKPSKQGIFQPS